MEVTLYATHTVEHSRSWRGGRLAFQQEKITRGFDNQVRFNTVSLIVEKQSMNLAHAVPQLYDFGHHPILENLSAQRVRAELPGRLNAQ